MINSICVFCGSSTGSSPEYLAAAQSLGPIFAQENVSLVYGGGGLGLMGAIAKSAIEAGVYVLGVQPTFLDKIEHVQVALDELIFVETMHQRKQIMSDRSDAFIALPGGMGTLEELAEIFTWAQLGIHHKPFGLLNVNGYFDKLIQYFDHMVVEGFFRPHFREMILVDTDLTQLIRRFKSYCSPYVSALAEQAQV